VRGFWFSPFIVALYRTRKRRVSRIAISGLPQRGSGAVNRLLKTIRRLRQAEFRRFVEYIMIMGLVGVAMAAVVITFTNHISSALSSIGGSV
jgi:hypothetical protein